MKYFAHVFDVVILTETWEYNTGYFNLDNYDIIYNDSKINKADGVLVYVKKNLIYTYEIIALDKVKFIRLLFNKNGNNVALTAVYKCHDIKDHVFLNSLRNYFNLYLLRTTHYEIFCGDTNIDILADKPNSNDYINLFTEFGFRS